MSMKIPCCLGSARTTSEPENKEINNILSMVEQGRIQDSAMIGAMVNLRAH